MAVGDISGGQSTVAVYEVFLQGGQWSFNVAKIAFESYHAPGPHLGPGVSCHDCRGVAFYQQFNFTWLRHFGTEAREKERDISEGMGLEVALNSTQQRTGASRASLGLRGGGGGESVVGPARKA